MQKIMSARHIIILITISVLLLASPAAAKKRKNNPLLKQKFTSVEQVVNELEQCEYFSLLGTDGFGYVHSNYVLAEHLDKLATSEQLDSLSSYGKTPIVKTTAFAVFVNGRHTISSEQVLSILLKQLPDTTSLSCLFHDLAVGMTVSSFFTEMAYSSGILSPADSAYADSLIFYTDEYAHNPRFYTIVKNNIGKPEIYTRIRDLYIMTCFHS